jgi:REP element-mobilizing transposase RayT
MLKELNLRKENWHKAYQQLSALEKEEASKSKDGLFFAWFDELLANSKQAPQILDREDIQRIIAEAFKYFDKQRYQLVTYCIMPNHVHVLILPQIQESGEMYSPAHIVYTWKRYTANGINRVLNRKGSLWHEASYDRMVRNEREFYNTMHYIIKNPVKAHLVDDWKQWNGSYLSQEYVTMIDEP